MTLQDIKNAIREAGLALLGGGALPGDGGDDGQDFGCTTHECELSGGCNNSDNSTGGCTGSCPDACQSS